MMAVWQPDDQPRRRLCPEVLATGRMLALAITLGLALWALLGWVAWRVFGG